MLTKPLLVLPAAFFALAACGGDDPVSYSEPVGIELKAESGKVDNGILSDEKGVTTESGNPYGAFVANAEDALNGASPESIDVTSVSILLGAGSTGAAGLGDIFDGNVEVLFIMNDTNDTFPVAEAVVDSTADGGPLSLDVVWNPDGVSGDNYTRLLGGSFKVVYRGDASAAIIESDVKGDLQITFGFEAFE